MIRRRRARVASYALAATTLLVATLALAQARKTGWSGAPVPLFTGETIHRWSVDPTTGAFHHAQTDFYLADTPPLVVTRVYAKRSTEDEFGSGTALSYDLYLTGDAKAFAYIDLSTPAGSTVHFVRTSPGTSYQGAAFRCDTPSVGNTFEGSTLEWDGGGWTLKAANGALLRFPAASGDIRIGQGALVAIEDPQGGKLAIDRDGAGDVRKITAPHGASVRFVHDQRHRIVEAEDSLGNRVEYAYDDRDRVSRVVDSREGTTKYFYDLAGNMVRVDKPDGSVWIRVDYDDRGRARKVTLQNGASKEFRYDGTGGRP